MATNTFEWIVPPIDAMLAAFDNHQIGLLAAIEQAMKRREPEIGAWMKINAPWTDRTGNARQSLHTAVFTAIGETVLLMMHGVDYGLWLEVRAAGAYGIVGPACDHWAPVIMRDLQAMGLRVR